MNKKIISLLSTGLLVSSLMVGCSSTNTDSDSNNNTESSIKKENHMTEEERIATLQGLEGDELIEAYSNLLNKDEINFLNEHGWKIEEEAKYYQDGINLKIPQNYSGNEKEAEKFIKEEMNKVAKDIDFKFECTGWDTGKLNWTNTTGNDIDWLYIEYKRFNENNESEIQCLNETNISSGETRTFEISVPSDTLRIEISKVEIAHQSVSEPNTIYDGCIPGKWYKLEAQSTNKGDDNKDVKGENTKENTGDKTTNNNAKDSMEVKNKTSENKSVDEKTQSKTTEKVTHKCFRCGKNATTYEGQWMCNDCYSEKIAHEEDEEFVNTDDAMQDDGYFYCKGCGKQMTDNNGGTYACDDCLNNN